MRHTRAPSFEALYARSQERQKDITSLATVRRDTVSSCCSSIRSSRAQRDRRQVGPGRHELRVARAANGDRRRQRLIVHWPKRDQLETLNIAETPAARAQVFTGASPADLAGFFDITGPSIRNRSALPR